jgi:cytoskeletal protein CcmA (bactofilin family)
VKTDLIIFGDSVEIDGTVDGDLISFGRNLTITGHVTGDVISFGNMTVISGSVDGSVRTFSNQFTLRGKIAKNLMGFGGQLDTDPQSTIGWGVTLFTGEATLNGRIERDILEFTGHMDLNGYVGGNIQLKASDTFTVGPHAQVMGSIKYKGPVQPVVSSGAVLATPIETTIEVRRVDWYAGVTYWHKLLYWGASFVFGLVLLLLAPGFFSESTQNVDRFGVSLGIGALTFVGIPFIALLACITVVGLGVGISTLLLWLIAMYGSKIFVATWLGRKIVGKNSFAGVVAGNKTWPVPYKGALIGQFALGLLLLDGIRLIPYFGFCVAILAQIVGFGALGLTLYRRMHPDTTVVMEAAPATA